VLSFNAELAENGGRIEYITWSSPTEGWFGPEFRLWPVEFE
jgi:hypothetical protein